MRLLSLFIFVANLFYFIPESQAQYRGLQPQPGVGYYGGTQVCPYGNGGRSRVKSVASLEMKLENAQDELKEKQEELDDLYNVDHELFDEKSLPLKRSASGVLIKMMNPRDSQRDSLCDSNDENVQQFNKDLQTFFKRPEAAVCTIGANGEKQFMSFRDLCEVSTIYDTSDARRTPNIGSLAKRCERWRDAILDLEKEVSDLDEEVADLEEDLIDAKYAEKKAEKRAEKYGYMIPEGQGCLNCLVGNPEPRGPTTGQLVTSGLVDLAGLYLGYRGVRYISDQNAALGWDTSPLVAAGAMASMYPGMTARLLASSRAGQGSGSWGCAGTINGGGYPNGANGGWGPNGIYSGYGQNVGGPFYAPAGCGYGCMQQAGSPFFPGAQLYGGVNMGVPGGFPGFYPGIGLAGNPYGNPGGIFGGLGAGFGGNAFANPFGGGLYGAGGMGLYGQGGFGNPYGGFGSPFGGLGFNAGFGGNPFGGQFGNPFGGQFGNPFGGQFGSPFGSPFGGNMYNQQLMQMQLQAQIRQAQNQQVAMQQMGYLQQEYGQLMNRYNMIVQQYQSGGFGGSYGGASYNPYFSPYQNGGYIPGSTVPTPPNGSSTGR